MRFERVDEADLDEVLALDRECFPLDAPVDALSMLYSEWHTTAAQDAYFALLRPNPKAVYLLRYGVRPRVQGRGLGRATALAALRAACNGKATMLRTYVLIHNLASLRCLLGCGFKPSHWGTNTLWLARDLTDRIPRI